MKSLTKRKLAVIAMSTVMTACVAGGVGYAKLNHAVLASADTANYAVVDENAQSWKNVTFKQNEPKILTLENVAAGQYCVTVKVTAVAGSSEDYYDITATGTGETVYLSMSSAEEETATFYGVVTVSEDGTLTLNTSSVNELTADVSLDSLFLSTGNAFYLPNIEIPGRNTPLAIDIKDSSAKNFTVQIDFGFNDVSGTILAEIGGVIKPLTRLENTDFNIYSATIEVPENVAATQLTLTSSSESVLVGSISLYELGAVTEITDDAATAKGVKEWNTAIFSYTPDQTGYVTAKITSATKVSTSTTVSKSAGTYSGSPVANESYPVYVESGTTYYFEVTLESIDSETETSADLTITIADWQTPTMEVGGTYSVPATPEVGQPVKKIPLKAVEGTYDLALTEVPYDYPMYGVVIKAYVGDSGDPVELSVENDYKAQVTISDGNDETTDAEVETTIHFTTSQTSRAVITVAFTEPEVINYIVPGEAETITVPAEGSITYFIEKAEAGVYQISLDAASANVSVMVGDVTVIPAGKTTGGFVIQYEGNDFGITFVNSGETDATITATVTAEDRDATIQLGIQKSITLANGQRQSFFMYSLAKGSFDLTVSPATGLTLMVDGEEVDISSGKATITISDVQDANGLVNFTFENTSEKPATFTVDVEPNASISLDNEFTVNVTPDEYGFYYATYYVNLTMGKTYAMALQYPADISVNVTINGTDFVYYGGVFGTYTATADGYATIRFNCGMFENKETKLTAYMNEYDDSAIGNMELGTPVTAEVDGHYTQYRLALKEGMFNVTFEGNVQVAINGTLVENGSTYYSYGDEEGIVEDVIVTIINFTGEPVTAKVTVEPTYLLELNSLTPVTIEDWSYSKIYYIELNEGNYDIELILPEGTSIQVTINGEVVIAYGDSTGHFTVSADQAGYVQVVFAKEADAGVTFQAGIYEA